MASGLIDLETAALIAAGGGGIAAAFISVIAGWVVFRKQGALAHSSWVRDLKRDAYVHFITAFHQNRLQWRGRRFGRPSRAAHQDLQDAISAVELIASKEVREGSHRVIDITAELVSARMRGRPTHDLESSLSEALDGLVAMMKSDLGLPDEARSRRPRRRRRGVSGPT